MLSYIACFLFIGTLAFWLPSAAVRLGLRRWGAMSRSVIWMCILFLDVLNAMRSRLRDCTIVTD